MMEKVSQIIIPFLFIVCVVTFVEVRVFSCINKPDNIELILSAHSSGTFHHNHCKEIEIFHEHFFDQTGHTDLSEIQVPPIIIHQDIKALLLNFTSNYWHPPKLT